MLEMRIKPVSSSAQRCSTQLIGTRAPYRNVVGRRTAGDQQAEVESSGLRVGDTQLKRYQKNKLKKNG